MFLVRAAEEDQLEKESQKEKIKGGRFPLGLQSGEGKAD